MSGTTPRNGYVYVDMTFASGRTHRIEVPEREGPQFILAMERKYGKAITPNTVQRKGS